MSNLNNNIDTLINKETTAGGAPAPQSGEGSPGVSLGNTVVNVTEFKKLTKWQLLCKVRDLLIGTNYGVLDCQKPVGQVEIKRGSEGVHVGGIATCKSVWLCPVCNLRISAERGDLIRQTQDKGFYMVMMHLTVQHNQGEKLENLLGALKAAARDLKTGDFWTRLKKEFGIIAYITAYEITYGENGWHPHVHMVIYFDGAPDLEDLNQKLVGRWKHVVEKVGRYASKDHGLKITKTDAEQGADYVTKFRSNLAYEMTGQYNKGKTFWELVQQGKRKLVLEYASATYRLKTLTWSHHAKKVLDIKENDIQDDEQDLEVLAVIPNKVWNVIRSHALQGFVLELAEIDQDALKKYLGQLSYEVEKRA